MILETLVVSPFMTNCYIVGCEETRRGAVIDPGDDAPGILSRVEALGLTVEKVLLTHGHVDHISAAGDVKEGCEAEVVIHEADAFMLAAGREQAAMFGWFIQKPCPAPDRTVEDGETVEVGSLRLEVLHTPGHSPGSVSYRADDHVFVGDLVFAGSVGRVDLPGGSGRTLIRSVREKILPLADDHRLFSGHGPETTVGEERRSNPYLQKDAEGLFF